VVQIFRCLSLSWLIAGVLCSCGSESRDDAPPAETPDIRSVHAVETSVRRLTSEQYRRIVADVFGDDLVIPSQLEPDLVVSGFESVGSGLSAVSARGVEQYEAAAYKIAHQSVDASRRSRVVPCEPNSEMDESCASKTFRAVGRRLWRRPLEEEELSRLMSIFEMVSGKEEDFYAGIEYGLAVLLQSPNFLFREEIGVPDPEVAGAVRYNDFEIASRLSFWMWNTGPDDALLDAAERGELTTAEGFEAALLRLLEDPRSRDGVDRFFREVFRLDDVEKMVKDPHVFPRMNAEVGPSAREETSLLLADFFYDPTADFRDVMTTRKTYVDRKLASIYGVPAPSRNGFGQVLLPDEGNRAGLLGHVSTLALHSHAVSTSATLRGLFVREKLLCEPIPAPPAEVDTSIPEPSAGAPTLRQRVAKHLEAEFCAGCHSLVDPLGLALERFDGLGEFRATDNGAAIDTAGDFDGVRIDDARSLGKAVTEHPSFAPCMVEHVTRYVTGTTKSADRETLTTFTDIFEDNGFQMQELWKGMAKTEWFHQAIVASEEEETP
jgi:hypothetical protein